MIHGSKQRLCRMLDVPYMVPLLQGQGECQQTIGMLLNIKRQTLDDMSLAFVIPCVLHACFLIHRKS